MKSEPLPKIPFSHNWNNKLSNSVFTTIRKGKNEAYYSKLVGLKFKVELNEKEISLATLHSCLFYPKLRLIPAPLLMVDTGAKTIQEAIGIFKKFGINMDDEVILLTFIGV